MMFCNAFDKESFLAFNELGLKGEHRNCPFSPEVGACSGILSLRRLLFMHSVSDKFAFVSPSRMTLNTLQ